MWVIDRLLTINQETNINLIPEEYLQHSIAEQFVHFNREVSLIAARNVQGDIVFYDICENIHINGILYKTYNRTEDPILTLASSHVVKMLSQLNYVGVFTVEFFQVNNELLANEIAPRVHNSGHWTLDACVTSQFENHLRAITNLPLGDTTSLSSALMYNLLDNLPVMNELLQFHSLKFHDYCKTSMPGRKLGHITFIKEQTRQDRNTIEKIIAREIKE